MTGSAEGESQPALESPAPPAVRGADGDSPQIKLQLIPIAVGTLVAFLLLRLLAFGLDSSGLGQQFFLLPLAQFIALYTGGFTAGRMARRSGFMNGVVVAVVFIVVWAILNAVNEAQLVQDAGPSALPRMNMGGIVIGDLLNLIPAAFGGWLAEKRT
ncbi:MAG: TIGR04086 family membrane protein [Chloroflexota bacterium]